MRLLRITFLGVLCACWLQADSRPAAALTIEKLLAFAQADQVRVDCVVTSPDAPTAVELTAEITQAESGQRLWAGTLTRTNLHTAERLQLSRTISGLSPALWSPTSPTLYRLHVTARKGDQTLAQAAVRFGFRSMEVRDGRFLLNGRPIFLRGLAINPPGRTIPETLGETRAFAEAYVRFLKSQNLNIFRISTDQSQVWFDVCDELGMLLYAGRYGSPPDAEEGKQAAPRDYQRTVAGYKTLFESYVAHPSIVLYYLANELPVSGARGAAFSTLLTRAHAELKQWDPTRPYIANAGYGEGREGDVCDVHRYWGWYYNSFLTYYNLRDKLREAPLFGDPAKNQPLTFTECVGSFTGSSGEFNVVRSKQLAPRLGWIGHTTEPRDDALRYQSFMVKQATESFRRLRPLNPRLAGIMPFTILFYNWAGIKAFEEMKPKPAMAQLAVSYQPVLLSWELWTSQVYAGARIHPTAHIINDDDAGRAITNARLCYQLRDQQGRTVLDSTVPLPRIAYFAAWSQALDLQLPGNLPTGDYQLCGSITQPAGAVSTNWTELFIAGPKWPAQGRQAAGATNPGPSTAPGLYDPDGLTTAALAKLGIAVQRLTNHFTWPEHLSTLVIGENAWDQNLAGRQSEIREFVAGGGRVLCLQQRAGSLLSGCLPEKLLFPSNSPNDTAYPPRTRPFGEQMNVNPVRTDHPVFRGLDRARLRLWSDYTGWDQTQPGFPRVYPVTAGFVLPGPEVLESTAILAEYDRGLEGVALAEFFTGKGSVILSGFDLASRAGLDPAADRLLCNLVDYATSSPGHEPHPLVEKPIRWGDLPTEQGVVCGSLNGLLINAEWVAPDSFASAIPLAPNTGAWNMKPGDQFIPRGRNPFGAYTYSTASSLKDLQPAGTTGHGFFWARVPPGRRWLITTVRNPSNRPGVLQIAINGAAVEPLQLAAGQTKQGRAALPRAATPVRVDYTGPRDWILLETSFE